MCTVDKTNTILMATEVAMPTLNTEAATTANTEETMETTTEETTMASTEETTGNKQVEKPIVAVLHSSVQVDNNGVKANQELFILSDY
mmetsp:Transcript_7633/g.12101  ORF Transcript_7633/g.12101 Transcript_7633/m.12101 type:complete len:88 (+) Transcript_7633:1136-1399(+)